MPTLSYSPPAYNTSNVVYGTALCFTATVGTSLPADDQLGVGSAWTGGGWSYIGATDSGVTLTWTPSTQDISIEEQPTPVAVLVTTANLQVTFDFSEETLANISMAYGNGSIATTSAGAGQPAKSVLSLSTTANHVAVGVVGKNQLGFARVFSIPEMMSAGTVATAFRRAASQRLYPTTFNTVCPFEQIQVIDLTAPASS
jgi:hypothetical protein